MIVLLTKTVSYCSLLEKPQEWFVAFCLNVTRDSVNNTTSLIDLSGLPLGALRKTQNKLFQTYADNQSDESEEEEDESETEPQLMHEKGKERTKVEWSTRSRKDIAKRANKHA